MTTVATKPEAESLREGIVESIPDLAVYGEAPDPRFLYVPRAHHQALSPTRPVVVGIRGSGKSVWWAALRSAEHRRLIRRDVPQRELDHVELVGAGFGAPASPDDYPDRRVLARLLGRAESPADIWRTVLAWQTWGRQDELAALTSWEDRLAWVDANPELVARRFHVYDQALTQKGHQHLVLFDALDRTASRWPDLLRLLRGLLELLLEARSFRSIRAKAFLRPDMLEDPAVTAFTDASKLTATKVELRWRRVDLYGLFFQRLANSGEHGAVFRELCRRITGRALENVEGIWALFLDLRESEDAQRRVLEAIAGKWMGRHPKRGYTYTWLPGHLADAREQVSPRSFLAALGSAASDVPPASWPFALHFDSIKRGVQEASRIRVSEVLEEFPWIKAVMEPLRGLLVPSPPSDVQGRWSEARVLDKLRASADDDVIPEPRRISEGYDGLSEELIDLGIFSRQPDSRINMPDVYRVGFGLGRRGGVKPLR